MLSVEELSVEDAAWIDKYVEQGGERAAGLQLVQKMNQAKGKGVIKPNTGMWPSTTSVEVPGLFSTEEAPAPPTLPEPPISNKVVEQLAQATPVSMPTPPKRRGRPPVNWNERARTQQELDLFGLSLEIQEKDAKEHGQLGFIATAMIYASLPHSDINSAVFKRKNGDFSLTMINDPDIGLPFGKIPRIITAFLCTEAKRSKCPEIELGRSQAEFAKKLGLNSGGGERGDLTRLKDQAKRLFTSRISLTGAPGNEFRWRNVDLTRDGVLLWNPQPGEKSAWQSRLTLSDTFFQECMQHSVPIDLRVVHQLVSPMAIDIYIWLTYRLNAINRATPIPWEQLKWQFGANYADDAQGLRNFISGFKKQLRRVLNVYPDAKVSPNTKTLTLFPSKSHIASVTV